MSLLASNYINVVGFYLLHVVRLGLSLTRLQWLNVLGLYYTLMSFFLPTQMSPQSGTNGPKYFHTPNTLMFGGVTGVEDGCSIGLQIS